MNYRIYFAAALICAMALTACQKRRALATTTAPKSTLPQPQTPPPLAEFEKKLDSPLLAIAKAQRSAGSEAALQQVAALGLEQQKEKVKVEIVAQDKKSVADLKEKVASLGGEVSTDLENHIWAFVPAAAIDPLSRLDMVWSMSAARATSTIR